jgi:hypothetical protein
MGALAKEVPGLISSIGTGIDKLATGAVGDAVKKGYNVLVGGQSGKPIAFQTTGSNGEVINVASDGTRTIMHEDGRVQNFDRNGRELPGTGVEGVDPASPPPSDGLTEQGLYDQEAIYQDYQNYADNYPYLSDDYYNPYDDAGY